MQLDPLVDYGAEIVSLRAQIAAATAAGRSVLATTLTSELNARVAGLLPDPGTAYDAALDTITVRRWSDGSVYELSPNTVRATAGAISAVATIAALKALASPNLTGDVIVEGYYAAGDGGGGIFRWSSADATADNGGSVIIPNSAPGTGRWNRLGVMDAPVNLRWFGAKGDGSTNDAPAVQACVTWAAGRKIYVPVGNYFLNATITSSLPVDIFGDGCGAGPGGVQYLNCSAFFANFTNPTAFLITSPYGSTFRDLQFNIAPAYRSPGSGYGIRLTAAGTATVALSQIENCAFQSFYIHIGMMRPAWPVIQGNYFDTWIASAIRAETDQAIEGSAGRILNNYFYGANGSSQGECIYLGCGYAIIAHNEILAAQVGVRVVIANHDAGFIRILNNTIENQYYYGVLLSSTGTNKASMWDVSGNEFSVISSATYVASVYVDDLAGVKWLIDLTICRNVTRHLLTAANKHYWIGAGENVIVANNVGEELGTSNPTFISINGSAANTALGTPFLIHDNISKSATSANFAGSTKYSLASNAAAVVKDNQGLALASLPGNAGNGSQLYVTDGLRASNPLTASSTGAMATRLNGAWSGG